MAALWLGPRLLNTDGDLPHHLAVGKYILQGHLPPVKDIFSFTRSGVPFAPHKWLASVLFYSTYLLFQERGIVLLSALLLAATFTILYNDGVQRTGMRLPVLLLTGAGAAVTSIHWIARPHLFSMLLFAIWMTLTEKLASGRKVSLWYFGSLMLLWTNLHGEFIAGFLVTAAALAGWAWDYLFDRPNTDIRVVKRLGWTLLVTTVITLVNPISLRAISTVTSWLGNDYLMSHTIETLPPNFADPKFYLLLGFLIVSILILATKHPRLPTRLGILLAGFTAMTLLSARNVHYYGIAAPFVLMGAFSRQQTELPSSPLETPPEKANGRVKGIIWPVLTVLAGLALLAFSPVGKIERFSPAFFPTQATEWLKSHPQQGHMFNSFDWGGYLSLELWPRDQVFIDSQGDIYGEAFIREYEQVVGLYPGWKDVLEKYQVRWALIPAHWDLARALDAAGWKQVYQDPTAIILVNGK